MAHTFGSVINFPHPFCSTDSKAKTRAVDAGLAYGLARVLSAKLDETHTLAVRARMLVADLLRVMDMQVRGVQVTALYILTCCDISGRHADDSAFDILACLGTLVKTVPGIRDEIP